ncbi:MAG TPA: Gfo/Idh/MocA family oxidoreductase [Acidimicrobiales bacterium]|nr:Gfo/Idh/MocA family oxidoreductase [Acidimicrobiales bacterium]
MQNPYSLAWALERPHRVALAGLGGIAQGAHLPAYAAFGIDVVAGADPDPSVREAVAKAYDFPLFESAAEMLAAVGPEVVDVTVKPGPAKNAVIEEALAAGCHVLAQKPFTYSLADAVALVEAAEAAGRLLAVNVQARYAPAFRAAQEVLAAGRIGRPLSAFVTSTFPLADDMTVDMGIHEMDLLRFWLDADPQRVRASRTALRDGREHTVIEADFGGMVGLIVEENHAPVVRPWSFRIHGEDGTIEGREQFGTVEPAEVVVRRAGEEPETVELGYAYVPDAFAHVMASLLHAVETGRPAPTAARAHLPSLAGVLAAQRAAQTGRTETVEATK